LLLCIYFCYTVKIKPILSVRFFVTEAGSEPVREWLKVYLPKIEKRLAKTLKRCNSVGLSGLWRKSNLVPKSAFPNIAFSMGKFFKQITRRSPFDSPHNLARCQIRCCTHQNMHMIFAYHSSDNPNFKGFTGLSNQFPNSLGNLTFQNLVAISRKWYSI
jgi:hypothetical protein